jgi:hypothetical protein
VERVEDEEERTIRDCQEWVETLSFRRGEEDYEIVDLTTGEQAAILDLAWPNGLQEGLTEPVALLLNETAEVETAAGAMGSEREWLGRDLAYACGATSSREPLARPFSSDRTAGSPRRHRYVGFDRASALPRSGILLQ